jgi:hypothetical protein
MLLFFFLLSFPIPEYAVEKRRKKVNGYILAALSLPLIISLGAPLYARQEYKKGISSFTKKFYTGKNLFY